jgi:hypothetical protein
MKKLLLGLNLLLCLLGVNIFAGEKVFPAAYVSDPPPEVDGSMARMSRLAGSFTFNSPKDILFGGNSWLGAHDLSGTVVMGYDSNYLYIAAAVTDDKISQQYHGTDIWKGDHIMVALQYPYSMQDENVWVFMFSPGNFDNIAPEASVLLPHDAVPSSIRIAARRTGNGYNLEAAVPWKLIGKTPQRHDRMRFDLMISDSDSEAQEIIMSSSPSRRRGRPWHVERLLDGVFARADGTFDADKLSQDVLFKTPEYRLKADSKKLRIVIPADVAAKARTLKLRAALEYKVYGGGQRAAFIYINGKAMVAKDCINRDERIQFGNNDMTICSGDGKWFITYGNLEGKGYMPFYSSGVKIHPCE